MTSRVIWLHCNKLPLNYIINLGIGVKFLSNLSHNSWISWILPPILDQYDFKKLFSGFRGKLIDPTKFIVSGDLLNKILGKCGIMYCKVKHRNLFPVVSLVIFERFVKDVWICFDVIEQFVISSCRFD